jgi:hypothetical protein
MRFMWGAKAYPTGGLRGRCETFGAGGRENALHQHEDLDLIYLSPNDFPPLEGSGLLSESADADANIVSMHPQDELLVQKLKRRSFSRLPRDGGGGRGKERAVFASRPQSYFCHTIVSISHVSNDVCQAGDER